MSERDTAFDWIESDGGPLVVLPLEVSGTWSGTDGIDYETACNVGDPYVGLIKRDSLSILVLGGEPLPTAWIPSVGLVRWIHGRDERHIQSLVRAPDIVEDMGEQGMATGFKAGRSGECLLQDSAYRIGEKNAASIVIQPGEHLVSTQLWSSRDGTNLVMVHRFSQ